MGAKAASEASKHRNDRLEQAQAKVLLVSVSNLHFFVEHNRGHHVKLATPQDPATARFGESFWRFLPRTLVGQHESAWRLETERLARRGVSLWHPRNHMLWGLVLPPAIALGLGLAFGPRAAAFFLAQSAMAVLLLEAV